MRAAVQYPVPAAPFPHSSGVVDKTHYSTVTLTGAQQRAVFFTVGGNENVSSLSTPNKLEGDNEFACVAVRVDVDEALADNSGFVTPTLMAQIKKGAVVEVSINNKPHWRNLVRDCPAGTGMSLQSADTAAAATIIPHNGAPHRGAFRSLLAAFYIRKGNSFQVAVRWPAAITFPANGVDITTYLDGLEGEQIAVGH